MTVAVKICGITRPEDAAAAAEAGADFVGLNFWPGSKRYVTIERARLVAAVLPPSVRTVGVFVNPTEAEVDRAVAEVGLALVQLHGDEPPAFLAGLSARLIRALRVGSEADLAVLADHPASLFLLDAPAPGYGGSGLRFDWSLAAAAHRKNRPFFLAGGLTPDTVAEAVRVTAPFGVDVASGVEEAPGKKDPALVRRFVAAAKGWIDR